MKKKSNVFQKILVICLTLVVLCSCIVFPASAAEYGEDIIGNTIELPTDTGKSNNIYSVPLANGNVDTLLFLMDYMQYLYSYNMTNGQKPFLVVIAPTCVEVYMVPVYAESVYVSYVSKRSNYVDFTITVGDKSGNHAYQRYILCKFGNFNIGNTATSTSTVSIYGSGTVRDQISYIYLNESGGYSYFAYGTGDGVYAGVADMYHNMKDFIDASYGLGGGGSSAVPEVVYRPTFMLDMPELITSIINAPRTIFDGVFGFTIFGINVASTLITILVVAIVLWIIKKWKGG